MIKRGVFLVCGPRWSCSGTGVLLQIHQMVDADWHDGWYEQGEAVFKYFKVSYMRETGTLRVRQ